jgi:hypothetical protein
MDNASKVAEVAWKGAYMFKLDHKNGYFHVPIHEHSRKYFGIYWDEEYYVLCVLPFGWKSSPYIYHSLTEAVNMYVRSLGIPMLGWIDDMLGLVQQLLLLHLASDEQQFQSCLRAMVVVSYVMFMAGYFLGITKCSLLPEQMVTYLGIECDTMRARFRVPETRRADDKNLDISPASVIRHKGLRILSLSLHLMRYCPFSCIILIVFGYHLMTISSNPCLG